MTPSTSLPTDVAALQALVQQLQEQLALASARSSADGQPSNELPSGSALVPAQRSTAALAGTTESERLQSLKQAQTRLQHEHAALQATHQALLDDLARSAQQPLPQTLEAAQRELQRCHALLHSLQR